MVNKPEIDKDGNLTFDVPLSPPFSFTVDNLQKLVSLYRCLDIFKIYTRKDGLSDDIPIINDIVDAIEKFRPDIIEENNL